MPAAFALSSRNIASKFPPVRLSLRGLRPPSKKPTSPRAGAGAIAVLKGARQAGPLQELGLSSQV